MAAFFERDEDTFGHCDDSYGHVGDVFRFDAKELFIHYARHCRDKDALASAVLRLNRNDDFFLAPGVQ